MSSEASAPAAALCLSEQLASGKLMSPLDSFTSQLPPPPPPQMQGANLYDVFQRISKCDFTPLPADHFSVPLRHLVARMLQMDPAKRPELEEVCGVVEPGSKTARGQCPAEDCHRMIAATLKG